jgi:ferritin-like metal-binding protein YciE
MMANETLRELWERELQDLHATEQKTIVALPEMINAATSAKLRSALEKHLQRTKLQLERLDLIFKKCGLRAGAGRTSGVDSALGRASEVVKAGGMADARDAAIIAAAQHVEHYEMAGYGCARTWARQLGDDSSADLLQQTLDEEGASDHELTDIAMGGINQGATAGVELDTAARPRLRYVDVNDLPAATAYRDTKIRNRAGEDLGKIDGFVVDRSGRPYYVVVDSGGLFVGRRYMVPVGRADFRRDEGLFIVDLDKKLFKRYPEFQRDAFLSMRDEEARRYEWQVLEAIDPDAARASTQEWDYDRFPYYRQPDWFDRGIMTPSEYAGRSDIRESSKGTRNEPPRVAPSQPAFGAGRNSPSHPIYSNERRVQPSGRRASDVH